MKLWNLLLITIFLVACSSKAEPDHEMDTVMRHILSRLREPDSFELIEAARIPNKCGVAIAIRYRARNGFGGMTVGEGLFQVFQQEHIIFQVDEVSPKTIERFQELFNQ